MELRRYTPDDCPAMAALFQETVRTVNAADYAPEQLTAWAGGQVDLPAWDRSFRAHLTLLAVREAWVTKRGASTAASRASQRAVATPWRRWSPRT